MPLELIGVGTNADDGNGDPLRDAGIKINNNFTELFNRVAALEGRRFGSFVYSASSIGVSTNTAADVFPDKLVLDTENAEAGSSTAPPPPGNYKLFVTYSFNCDSVTSDARIYTVQDGVGMLNGNPDGEHRQELQDSGGAFGATGTDQKLPVTRMYPIVSTGGHIIFRLRYAPSVGGTECSVWGASMMLVAVDE